MQHDNLKINPQSGTVDPLDHLALEKIVVGALLVEPDRFLVAIELPPCEIRDPELRVIYAALLASGPPDWLDAGGVFARICDRLARYPGARVTARHLRDFTLHIKRRAELLDLAVASLLGQSSDADREAVAARARLYFAAGDAAEELSALRRIQHGPRMPITNPISTPAAA